MDTEALIENAPALDAEPGIASGARREPARIEPAGGVLVRGRRSDRQDTADRLDPMDLTVRIDELFHRFNGRSSSAIAKQAEACFRISLAWRSSRTSRRSRASSSFSARVGPGRVPPSRSVCRTQVRSVSPEQPICDAIDWIAAHCGPVLLPMVHDHPDSAGAHLETIGRDSLRHRSTLSRGGASGKHGALHSGTPPATPDSRRSETQKLQIPMAQNPGAPHRDDIARLDHARRGKRCASDLRVGGRYRRRCAWFSGRPARPDPAGLSVRGSRQALRA